MGDLTMPMQQNPRCSSGTLVRSSGSVFGDRVFFVSQGRRHWVRDGRWLAQHGFTWPDDVREIPAEVLTSFAPAGPAPLQWSDDEAVKPPPGIGSLALREIAGRGLRGTGVEFGAGASPFPVPLRCRVLFADRLAHDALTEELYPGQLREDLVVPDLVTDFDSCADLAPASLDFIVACHVIEHTRDPIGAIVEAWRRLRPGGSLVMAVPARDRTFDRDRECTPLAHLVADFESPDRGRDYAHYEDFYAHAFRVPESEYRPTVDRRFAESYAIHYHVWTHDTFMAMVDWLCAGPAPFSSVWSHPGGDDPASDTEFYAVLTK
jgi:SAM-dependent methyltransferase